jgi:hypothetical protein
VVTMSSDGHQEVLEGLGFEVLGHLHGSSHFLHRFFEKSHFLQLDPQIVPLFARFSTKRPSDQQKRWLVFHNPQSRPNPGWIFE